MTRRALAALVATATLAAGLVLAARAAAAPATRNSLGPGAMLTPTQSLRSTNGRYTLTLRRGARLVVTDSRGRWMWATRNYRTSHSRLVVHAHGDVVLAAAGRILWHSGTSGVSSRARLVMRDNAALSVLTPQGVAWSSTTGNRCGSYGAGKRILVDLSEQYAWMCRGNQQVQTSAITSGAVALGMGTPTGTWHLQSKQHNRYLYPAAGGAYYVHYWLPYDGDYGLHDSSWQHFPYGSQRYRTEGSHGCVHIPFAVIKWIDAWAPLGTMVRIRA
jgi:hypothetical protein